jgi:predicted acetyltransferase
LIRNLFEHYIHDMSEWLNIDTQPDGSYSYDTSHLWRNGCDIYLAKIGDAIAGFAIVGSAVEWTGDSGVHDVREFFILRRYRRRGVGRCLASLLWEAHAGEWLVRVFASNTPAVRFWRGAISRGHASYTEERRMVNARPWRFFRFAQRGLDSQ